MDHLKLLFVLTLIYLIITLNVVESQQFERPERPESFKDSGEVREYLQKLHTYLATKTGRYRKRNLINFMKYGPDNNNYDYETKDYFRNNDNNYE